MTLGKLLTLFALAAAAFSVGACATAYSSTDVPVASCQDFERIKEPGGRLRKQMGDSPMPSEQLRSSGIADAYRVSEEGPTAELRPIIVRYSESGNLVNRCDYSKALRVIESIEEEKVILIFVHGWRNDSGSRSNLTYNFKDSSYPDKTLGNDLEIFSELATRVARQTERPVVPVFISWKAGSGIPVFDYATFWDRKGGSDRIVRSGEVSRLIGAIENIDDAQQQAYEDSRVRDEAVADPDTEKRSWNQIVFIGHSFGSRILYGNIVQDMIVRTQLAYPTQRGVDFCDPKNKAEYLQIKSPADLVLLFNPAFDAAAYRAIDEFSYSCPEFHRNQAPLLMVFQSRSDKAVRLAFPAVQFLSFQFGSLRTTGVGFWKNYWTHNMRRYTPDACTGGDLAGRDRRYPSNAVSDDGTPQRYAVCAFDRKKLVGEAQMPVRPIRETPFNVVLVEEDVLDGHVWFNRRTGMQIVGNDDRGEAFNAWLVDLISRRSDEFFRTSKTDQ